MTPRVINAAPTTASRSAHVRTWPVSVMTPPLVLACTSLPSGTSANRPELHDLSGPHAQGQPSEVPRIFGPDGLKPHTPTKTHVRTTRLRTAITGRCCLLLSRATVE
jgi:hypothetical protein